MVWQRHVPGCDCTRFALDSQSSAIWNPHPRRAERNEWSCFVWITRRTCFELPASRSSMVLSSIFLHPVRFLSGRYVCSLLIPGPFSVLGFVAFFITICYHTTYAVPWIFPPMAFYGLDLFLRMIRLRVKDASLVACDNQMTIVMDLKVFPAQFLIVLFGYLDQSQRLRCQLGCWPACTAPGLLWVARFRITSSDDPFRAY